MSDEDFMRRITLTHGAGGALTNNLIKGIFLKRFSIRKALDGVSLDDLDDSGSIKLMDKEVVISIDSHTVDPIFFPGGDIGSLSIAGTVNDVAMLGAKPIAIVDAIVVEEGFPIETLERIVDSMDKVAKEVPVAIISGDFKVMPKGKVDNVIITTAGIGMVDENKVVLDKGAKDGDKVIVTNNIGEHGIAILSAREGLKFEGDISSDVAPIWDVVESAMNVGGVHAMKDPTRGGLIGALGEIAEKSKVSIWIDEEEIPIRDAVINACEMLGIDPLELICEGCAVIVVESEKAEEVLKSIKKTKHGKNARMIGEVKDKEKGKVFLRTSIGSVRPLEIPIGEPLPRIC
ncbi:MAG: hydrogenase expression/formation protein HypE [Candidatus Asgardarchaeia archaeon]